MFCFILFFVRIYIFILVWRDQYPEVLVFNNGTFQLVLHIRDGILIQILRLWSQEIDLIQLIFSLCFPNAVNIISSPAIA